MGKNNANGCQLPATECSLHPTPMWGMERERGETESKGDDAVRELLLMTFSECAGFCCSVDQKGVCCVCEGERLQLWPGLPPFVFNAFCFIVLQKQKKKKERLARSSCGLNGFMTHLISMAKLFIWQQRKYSHKNNRTKRTKRTKWTKRWAQFENVDSIGGKCCEIDEISEVIFNFELSVIIWKQSTFNGYQLYKVRYTKCICILNKILKFLLEIGKRILWLIFPIHLFLFSLRWNT